MHIRSLLVLTALTALAHGQAAVDALRYTTQESSLSSDFHGIAGGNLMGHGVPDAVFVAGTEPILCSGLTLHAAVQRLPNTGGLVVHDVATLPGGGRNGRDAVAMVTDAGLRLWFYDDNQQPHYAVQSLGGPQWQGATQVRCGDVDGDGVPDVVGLIATGKKLRVFARGSTATHYAVDLGVNVLAFEVLQWDGSGAAELAVLTETGLRILSGDGTTQQVLAAAPMTGGCLARVPGGGNDLLAWSTTDLGQPELRLLGDTVLLETLPLAKAPTALAGGDVDGDGDSDIVATVADDANPCLYAVVNGELAQLGGYVFDDQPVTGNRATAFVADCDGDGVEDIALPLPGSQRVGLVLGPNPAVPTLELADGLLLYDDGTHPGETWFRFWYDTQSFPVGATHVEVRTWSLLPTPNGLVLGPQQPRRWEPANPEAPQHTFEVHIDSSAWNAVGAMATAVAFVERDAQGAVVHRHPFRVTLHYWGSPPTIAPGVIEATTQPVHDLYIEFAPGTSGGGLPVGGSGGKGSLPPPPPPPVDPPEPPSGG
ncbi:MAG: FG-GAP repeat domain-containing protein [Planctomycetota bacterium]